MTKLYTFFIIVFFLITANTTHAKHTVWTGAAADHLWFTAANWDNGVPMIGDTASISMDSVIINNITGLATIQLSNGARLVITPSGNVNLDNSIIAIECTDSRIYHYGIMTITFSAMESIVLEGTSVFETFGGSSILLTQPQATPLYCDTLSELNLRAASSLIIFQPKGAVVIDGVFKNRGDCHIIESQILANVINNGLILNRGKMHLDSSAALGLYNEGIFENYDTLIVDNSFSIGIRNLDSFTNMTGGYVSINHINVAAAFSNADYVLNEGTIDVANTIFGGISNSGDFYNRWRIDVSHVVFRAMENFSFMSNANGARIRVDSCGDQIESFLNGNFSFFLNEGIVKISNSVNPGIFNNGIIANLDTIEIYNLDSTGIINVDSIDNYDDGYIFIHDLGGSAVGLENRSGTITNDGMIDLVNMPNIGMINESTLVNNDTIHVDTAEQYGLINRDSLFNNINGCVWLGNIQMSAGSALLNDTLSGSIQNKGKMNIWNYGGKGIDNRSYFANDATVLIHNGNDIAFSNSGEMLNDSMSLLQIDTIYGVGGGILNDQDGGFMNYGNIEIDEVDNMGIQVETGIFQNYNLVDLKNVRQNDAVGIDVSGIYLTHPDAITNISELLSPGSIGLNMVTINPPPGINPGNLGTINISNINGTGLYNNATPFFSNAHVINIDDVVEYGIYNMSHIQNDASISIAHQSDSDGAGFYSADFFWNQGENSLLILDSIRGVGYHSEDTSRTINSGVILMDSIGREGIKSFGEFTNFDSISIKNTYYHGIISLDTFENRFGASIIISDAIGVISNGFENTGSVTNDGMILFQEIEDNGIKNWNEFVNRGIISIEGYQDTGLNLQSSSSFFNSGNITITGPGMMGILNTGLLENVDTIRIDSAKMSVLNTDSLVNDTTALLLISNTSNMNNGTDFENRGHITNQGRIEMNSIMEEPGVGQCIYARLNSFWNNTEMSELLLNNVPGATIPYTIDVGSVFITSGLFTISLEEE